MSIISFITSRTNAFSEATFREILLPSLGNVNNYIAYIYREHTDLDGVNVAKLADLVEKLLI